MDRVYEMLWDCKYCGQRKNLGLTHRHCPSCGAPQDAGARYFPPENEKVAVQDHPYSGADVHCPACKTAMSRAAKCCGNCGSPLTGGAAVRLVDPSAQQPVGQVPAQPPPPKKGLSPLFIALPLGCGGLLLLGLIALVSMFFIKKGGELTVASVRWERTIEVERYDMKRDSDWCDSVPPGAKVISRRKEERSSKQIPDGETCTKRKQDLGNGTYKEVEECTPKYKSEPIYDQKCDYDILKWQVTRTAKSEGATGPAWPDPKLAKTGTCTGCEREGKRAEKYTVTFNDSKSGKTDSCDYPESKWSTFKTGGAYSGQVRMLGGIDCDSVVPR